MMRQYMAIKAKYPDEVVFYRMGDFYEMFLRDAEMAAPLLDIALTTRDKGKDDAVPMCGVPVHAADQHIKRLADLGYRVAICEQVEDASATGGKRLVRRDVIEVVTPGLVGDPSGIDAKRELVIVALSPGDIVGMAALDASTGDLRATEVIRSESGPALPDALQRELQRVDPREIILPAGATEIEEELRRCLPDVPCTFLPVDAPRAVKLPDEIERLAADTSEPISGAVAGLVAYVMRNQPFALTHTSRLRCYAMGDAMVLDEATRTHLELFRNGEDGTRERTLIDRLDETSTPLGARRLARWIAYPLLDVDMVARRQAAVSHLVEHDRPRARLRDALRPIRDLERSLAKTARPTSSPRDLAVLRASLEALPNVARALDADAGGELLTTDERLAELRIPDPVPEAATLLREALIDDPPVIAKGSRGANETGYIRSGFHAELDGLREGVLKGREWIAGLEADERNRTGIPNLKIRFHPVHGYSIEVSKAQLSRVPSDYERKQTLANAERFTTQGLREVEQKVRGGTERAASLERELFEKVRLATLAHSAAIGEAAEAVAVLDATASLAEVARRDGWVRPEVHEGEALEIRAGRHPVVEPLLIARGAEEFVPNDTDLDPSSRQILVLTGPNMSGKSTYLRQVALIVLLAQMGSFVPAESARIGIVDRIFTRVGASDRLARGESTFMVEMRETAEILAEASRRSLIILDEIGRGTSTFDGLSIAWAVAEYLHDTPGRNARTLFATHYHELTDLARTKPRVANAHFEAREWGEEVLFLRRLVPGGASRSYGIQVARLAGLPALLIERAREILQNLEGGELDDRGRPRLASHRNAGEGSAETNSMGGAESDQLGLFTVSESHPEESEALAALRDLDPERTTPLEALELVTRIHEKLEKKDPA